MPHFDLIVRNALIYDGRGGEPFVGDIAVDGATIREVGAVEGAGRREIDAKGLAAMPGFVDIHTHYDGQATWSDRMTPSSDHGVTTVVMGNCGVGFAPCRPQDREVLVKLMEGVEDIPEVVMEAGIPWTWESFAEYLDFLDGRRFDVDVSAQLPHAPLRVYVMGERAGSIEDATDEDIARMKALTEEALAAGALGFSTTRSINHRSANGEVSPSYHAAEKELIGIASALREADAGVLQGVADMLTEDEAVERVGLFRRMAEAAGRPTTTSVVEHTPNDAWRKALETIGEANRDGVVLRAQVFSRALGLIMGLELSQTPVSSSALFKSLRKLPLAERVAKLREPEVRATIIAEAQASPKAYKHFDRVYHLGDTPNYEPDPQNSLANISKRTGVSPFELAYDMLLEREGHGLLYGAMSNYYGGSLEHVREMLTHPDTVVGIGDGGAHYGLICDASYPTHMLSYWGRDRASGERLPLPFIVKTLTKDNADAVGFTDRGVIAPGMKADLNIVDLERLSLSSPEVARDLPRDGVRMRQSAHGYVATIVSGVVTRENGVDTGARPGRLVRGAGAAHPKHAVPA